MEILGDFELYSDQSIGKGGCGEVFKGKQISLNRPVAIKFLNKDLTQDESFVHRFHREAECLAKLTDEHIIQIYGAGEHQGSHYFAMEYVPGVSLEQFIQRKYKFSSDDVTYIAIAVAKALKSAWESEEQIIHRDVKPGNIMLSFPPAVLESKKLDMKEARIKVMDFGLARVAKPTGQDKDLTMSGMIVGTPKYISPEQALGKSVDIRTDIYSLGIVLYEIATGWFPFENDTVMGVVQQHINETPPAPKTVNPQILPEIESIILKCIQKNPAARYRNPSELLEDLEAVRQKRTPLYAKPQTEVTNQTLVIQSPKKRTKRLFRVIVFLAVMASLGVIAYTFISRNPTVRRYMKPNIEPAAIGKPCSSDHILGDDEMKIISHTKKNINNPFDYGISIKVFVQNHTAKPQSRNLRVELDWGGNTFYKERQVFLAPKKLDTFIIDFYEPTASEEYYTYRVLLTK